MLKIHRGNYTFLQVIISFPPILSQIGLIFPSYPRISPLLCKTRLTDDASSAASYDALRYGPPGGGGKLIHTPVKYIPLGLTKPYAMPSVGNWVGFGISSAPTLVWLELDVEIALPSWFDYKIKLDSDLTCLPSSSSKQEWDVTT